MPWRARLLREAIPLRHEGFDLLYHASLRPALPPEYVVPGLVAVTFRLRRRPGGGHEYVTALDVDAALRLGERLGLDAAEALAFVDSHERVHVALQTEYTAAADRDARYPALADEVPEHVEEEHSRFVDAVWLSLRHPRAERLLESGEFGLVTKVGRDFWELLVDEAQRD